MEKGPIANRPLPDEELGKDADLLRIARERYQKAIDHDQDNRDAALEDLEFLAGDQWPDEIRRQRQEDSRPILTINRMPQFVRQVTGDIRQNRPAIKVRPGDDRADDDIAEIYAGTIRNIEYASDAMTAYQIASEGAAQCGIGHFRVVTAYPSDDTFEQDIRIEAIPDHFAVTWDPHAVKKNRSDARYCFVEESLDIETFKARYPKADTSGWDFQDQGRWGDWLTHDTVRIAEYWTIEKAKRTLAFLGDGRTIDVTDLDSEDGIYRDAETGEPLTVLREREVMRNQVEMRIINGSEVLEGPFEWPGKYIPVVPVLGEEIQIQRKTVRFGVIRHAKDAQRMYNFWRAAQTEKIALEPKVPWLVTVKQILGVEKIWKQANTRNLPYLPYVVDKDAPGLAPQRNAPQMGSAAMANEVLTAADDMKATTGIYDAGLGAQSNETSGVAIRARQQESDISTSAYSDNLSRAITQAGRILVDLIPKIYDTERVVRLLNEDETTKAVRINQIVVDEAGMQHKVNDLSLGKYDVYVMAGPSYTTKRDAAVDGMLELIKFAPEIGKLILDILVVNLDWPGAEEIAERIRKTLPPGIAEPREGEEPPQPAPPTPEQMAEQAKMEMQAGEAARKDAEAAAKIAKTEAETEATQVDTAQKALELAMQNGALEEMIAGQVQAMLAQMFGQQQPPPFDPGMR